jgi:hypothetical protein
MMLAFLVDQASDLCCRVYSSARSKAGVKYDLWERMRSVFRMFAVDSWEVLFLLIAGKMRVTYTLDSG